jgi:putative SOS response-associated peptidase YedK
MCGRYTYFVGEFADLKVPFALNELPQFKPRYNIAPGQQAPVIAITGNEDAIEMFKWGLVPSWAKDPAIGNRMINARAETLAEKPSFKRLLKSRRCLVLANGFYEWRKEGKRKVPMYFKLKSDKSFTFAGLWDRWKQPDGKILNTYTIVTTEPNELLARVHNRMPVLLANQDALDWLNCEGEIAHALSLLKPCAARQMEGYDVSTLVNNPHNDSPSCVAPASGD